MTVAIRRIASFVFNSYYRMLEAYYSVLEKSVGLIAKKDHS
jgi:hypothetical protein